MHETGKRGRRDELGRELGKGTYKEEREKRMRKRKEGHEKCRTRVGEARAREAKSILGKNEGKS